MNEFQLRFRKTKDSWHDLEVNVKLGTQPTEEDYATILGLIKQLEAVFEKYRQELKPISHPRK